MQRLTDTLDFQAKALVLRAERQRLIASNIANADTPGYVARDMDFARALQEATGPGQAAPMAATRRASEPGRRRARRAESAVRQRRARAISTATASTWTASARPSPTTR